ncbi:ATP-binding protein [Streptomyces sp. NBC_00006]|uniref:ATP-binding protein n=1 Tax=unclassified Streptomyces TaxID=2593676 RepID=UPI002258EEAB|nr:MULTISPECIES: ATP-binding protein [unclassified Streptomyces]MCX4828965.1 ATP-binding protein [Streptomyces sp. NBC_01016]MCX5531684.1 ATP-binding protein [Streptomyces sp. NBC_00006]
MKHSAAKTLGVAALGAAFAAAGAGAANAAPAVPDAADTVGSVTSALPLQDVASTLPAGAESLAAGQGAVANGLSTATPVVDQAAKGALPVDGDPVSGLLGGLPVGGLS